MSNLDFLDPFIIQSGFDEKQSKKENLSGWSLWVDEYGEWFNPYKPNPNQLELFGE